MELASILPNEIIKSLIGIKIKLKIKKPRISKFGDCKYKINEKTVNNVRVPIGVENLFIFGCLFINVINGDGDRKKRKE